MQACVRHTGHNVDDAIRNAKRLVELLRCADHLVEHLPGFAVVRGGVDELLDLKRTLIYWLTK